MRSTAKKPKLTGNEAAVMITNIAVVTVSSPIRTSRGPTLKNTAVVTAKARKMNAWFIDKDNIKPLLDKVMPGATWLPWRSTAGVNVRKIAGLVEDIKAHLDGLPETVDKVSIRRVKADMGERVQAVSPRTWTFALERYLDDGPPWRLVKSSLERWSETFSQVAE